MITRYLSSAATGLAVTTALLWVMHHLIESGQAVMTDTPSRHPVTFVKPIDDTPVRTREPIQRKIPPPPIVPAHTAPTDPTGKSIPVGPTVLPAPPERTIFSNGFVGFGDGALINIINAQPEYPVRAMTQGLEGYVIVSFDVTELGTVTNVQVVESSSRLFEKAAIDAAYRSRYKPKTVDGVAQGTAGLRKMFTFEMKT